MSHTTTLLDNCPELVVQVGEEAADIFHQRQAKTLLNRLLEVVLEPGNRNCYKRYNLVLFACF